MDQPTLYEICVRGQLRESWSDWLGGMTISPDVDAVGHPVTMLRGMIVDQAALHGVFARLRDLNLVIVSVVQKSKP